MAFRFVMRHESSLIKSLCCKAWRRSMTGVFLCPRFCRSRLSRCVNWLAGPLPVAFCSGGGSASWRIGWNGAQKYIMPHSGILKNASRSLAVSPFLDARKGETVHLGCGRRFVAEGAWCECAAYVWRFYNSMLLEEPSISSILAMPSFKEKNVRRGSPQSS